MKRGLSITSILDDSCKVQSSFYSVLWMMTTRDMDVLRMYVPNETLANIALNSLPDFVKHMASFGPK